jgi:hypothetical protein
MPWGMNQWRASERGAPELEITGGGSNGEREIERESFGRRKKEWGRRKGVDGG